MTADQMFQTNAEKTLLQLINNYRAENGVGPLAWNTSLKRAASWMNNDMVVNNYFNHTDSAGRNPGVRIKDCGYNWSSWGENIFPNGSDPQSAFNGWKNSPPHNANMLKASFTEAGIGSGGSYWTLDLGSSSNAVSPAPTSGQISVVPSSSVSPSNVPIISPTGTPVPTPTPSIILNPTDTKVRVSIKLVGIGPEGNRSPKRLTRQVVVGIYSLDNKLVRVGNGFLKYNNRDVFEGTIHLGQLANGTYYTKILTDYTLTALVIPQFQSIRSDSENALPTVMLTHGDYDQNNVIDTRDYNLVLPCFQRKSCPSKEAIDINDDGSTNVLDYNLFLSSFKRYEGD